VISNATTRSVDIMQSEIKAAIEREADTYQRKEVSSFESIRQHDVVNRSFKNGAEYGYKLGLMAAAKEAESWWELFNFDSFAETDLRRTANPNQIAERIRSLLNEK